MYCIVLSSLDRLSLTTGQYTNATMTITPPAKTPSGTDVTLTVEAKSSSGVDSNYVVLRFSVVTKVNRCIQDYTVESEKRKMDNTIAHFFKRYTSRIQISLAVSL